jgi:hypothetical protein
MRVELRDALVGPWQLADHLERQGLSGDRLRKESRAVLWFSTPG